MLKKNEKGFTLAESLLSLMIMAMLAAFILPFMVQMTSQSKALWDKQRGMRILYEEGEKRWNERRDFHVVYNEAGEMYDISWETTKAAACLEVSQQEICIKEQ
ncbi:type II secretion system protein [Bacillus sp. B190/17]|uniref:Type II secretion system protein n=1 Tax=Bacillus lumedeiriae TaxID=3058829 RepID=A0ABW8I4D9_9BACI